MKDRRFVAAMQRKLMADFDRIENEPNDPIVSRNNSPRSQSNSSSDQSYHTAYDSPRRNSSSDQSYYTAYGSPQRQRNSSSDQSYYYSPRSQRSSSSDQSYHSAYDYLDDSSIQLPRNATPPNSPDYSAQRTSTPSNYPLTPPALFDFGGELSPICTPPRYVTRTYLSPQSYVTSSSSDSNRSPAQAMDISSTFLEPMDVSSRYYNSRI